MPDTRYWMLESFILSAGDEGFIQYPASVEEMNQSSNPQKVIKNALRDGHFAPVLLQKFTGKEIDIFFITHNKQ